MAGIESVIEKKFFYRDSMRAAIRVAMVSMLLNVILAAGLIVAIQIKPEPRYFAHNLKGGLTEIKALDQPIVNTQGLLSWVNESVTAIYTYDFVNWRRQLSATEIYFTPSGYKQFTEQLAASGTLATVEKSRMVVSSVAAGVPVVEASGLVNGVFTWRVAIPITVNYQSANEMAQRKKLIRVTVQRASTLEKEYGIAISQVIESTMGVN